MQTEYDHFCKTSSPLLACSYHTSHARINLWPVIHQAPLRGRNGWECAPPGPRAQHCHGRGQCCECCNHALRPAGCICLFLFFLQTVRLFLLFAPILNHLLEMRFFVPTSMHPWMLPKPKQKNKNTQRYICNGSVPLKRKPGLLTSSSDKGLMKQPRTEAATLRGVTDLPSAVSLYFPICKKGAVSVLPNGKRPATH